MVRRRRLVLDILSLTKHTHTIGLVMYLIVGEPQELAAVHSTFYISMLNKCIRVPSLIIPTEEICIK